MRKISTSVLFFFMLATSFAQNSNKTASAFIPGNIVVYRVGDGAGFLVNTGSAVFLDEYTTAGVLVQSIAMPTTTSGSNTPLIASGTATSEGLLTRSSNGQYLIVTGYNSTIPASASLATTASATVPRTIGRINNAGTVNTTTSLTDYTTANNPRSATSIDGTAFWGAGGAGGVIYATLGSTSVTSVISTTVTNIRSLGIFGGQLYFSSGSGTTRFATVGTGTPTTTGQTATLLPGFPATGTPNGFFFADVNASVPGVDVLYVADEANGIQKYSLVSGTWTLNSTVGTSTDAYRGLTGVAVGSVVNIYATRKGGSSTTGGGELVSLVDASGYNGTIITTPVLLATAAANTAFRGVALTPTVNPLPLNLLSFNAGLINKEVNIWWSTVNEINTDYFEVEKSTDAIHFNYAGRVSANNTSALNAYTFKDATAIANNTYYRLKMVDKSGLFKYSSIVLVSNKSANTISIYPNPATTNIVVNHPEARANTTAKILSADGKTIISYPLQTGSIVSSLNVSGLAKGKYLLVVENGSSTQTAGFIKL